MAKRDGAGTFGPHAGYLHPSLILVLVRLRGWNEACWTCLGGALMLASGLETPTQTWRTVQEGQDVLLFLLALLLLSVLIERSGFFEWAAIWAART